MVSRVREARNSSRLIEVNGGAAVADQVRQGIVRSLGLEAEVRRTEQNN